MSGLPMADDLEDDPPDREELIEETKDAVEDLEAKQSEALAAMADEETANEYATVTLGEVDVEVKAWVPGNQFKRARRADRLARSDDPDAVMSSIDTMIDVLADMTVDDTYDAAYWTAYFDEYGPTALGRAIETVLEPAIERHEDLEEAVESFR